MFASKHRLHMQKEHTENINYCSTAGVLQAQRGEEVQLYSFFNHGIRWGRMVRHTPATSLGEKTHYPLYRRLDGPHSCSEQMQKYLPLPGFDPQTIRPTASRYTQ